MGNLNNKYDVATTTAACKPIIQPTLFGAPQPRRWRLSSRA